MAIDFPASPTLNDVFTVGTVTYVWDGTKWTASVTGGISLDKIEEGNTSAEVIDTGSDGRFVVTTEGTERLRVTNTGRVGIGTQSPNSFFHVKGGNNNVANIDNDGSQYTNLGFSNNGTEKGAVYWDNSNSVFVVGPNAASSQLLFRANNAERARIDSSGRLGIGTSSPGATLDVTGSTYPNFLANRSLSSGGSGAATWTAARVQATTTEQMSAGFAVQQVFVLRDADAVDNTVASILVSRDGADNSGSFAIGTASAGTLGTRLHVTSGGNVGIGTISVTAGNLLEVRGRIESRNDSASEYAFYARGGYASGGEGGIRHAAGLLDLRTAGAYALTFSTNNSEVGRFDTSGRLLVGTSSTSSNSGVVIQGTSGGSDGILRLASDNDTPANGESIGVVAFSASNHSSSARIVTRRDGGTWTPGTSEPVRIEFATTANGASFPTERMRITRDGYLKQSPAGSYNDATALYNEFNANTANSYVVITRCTSASPASEYIQDFRFSAATPNNTSARFWNCRDATADRAYMASNGGLYNYSANNSNLSDRNAKKDITPAADTWDCIKEWEIVNYRYKDQPDATDLNLGVIAQQVAESCPEVITVFQEAKEATEDQPAQEERLGVKEQRMYWMAIKALQEAQVRIEQLETEMAAVKAQLS